MKAQVWKTFLKASKCMNGNSPPRANPAGKHSTSLSQIFQRARKPNLTFLSQKRTETAASTGQQQGREWDANQHARDRTQSTQQDLQTIKGPETICNKGQLLRGTAVDRRKEMSNTRTKRESHSLALATSELNMETRLLSTSVKSSTCFFPSLCWH